MGFEVIRNVNGIFVSSNRGKDTAEFSEIARVGVPGYTGCSFAGNDPDNITFIFDCEHNQQSIDALDSLLSTYHDTSLSSLKRKIWDNINSLRDQIQFDRFVFNGARWDCKAESRAMITGAVALAVANGGNLPPNFIFRDYDNNNHPMTGQDMVALGAALFEFTGQCYHSSWIHKYYVGILTDAEQVKQYDYTVGWPQVDL